MKERGGGGGVAALPTLSSPLTTFWGHHVRSRTVTTQIPTYPLDASNDGRLNEHH